MENSDSESECFESAEESLDEDGESKIVETKSKRGEKEVDEPVYDNVDSEPPLEQDVSRNSTSYRRRPDRVKRSISSATAKTIPKLPSNDAIFKTDKIVPDAFFQDITSNLSKNINKSLSTLQQKSSNVKDLILNSFPVSSVNDDKGFSYDEVQAPMQCEVANLDLEPENISHSNQSGIASGDNLKQKEERNEVEKLLIKGNSPVKDELSGSNKKRKPPDIVEKNQNKIPYGDSDLKGTSVYNTEKGIGNLTLKEKQDDLDSLINETSEVEYERKGESVTESRSVNSGVFDSAFSNEFSCIKTSQEEERRSNSNIKEAESDNTLNKTTKKFETSKITSYEPIETETVTDNKQNYDVESVSDQLLLDDSISVISEPVLQNMGESISLMKINTDNLDNFTEKENESDLKCNLEELKVALENIVQDKKPSSNESEENTKEAEGDVPLQEDKAEFNQSSNDGWDDFDFSDDELENVKVDKTNAREKNLTEAVVDDKITAAKKLMVDGNKTHEKHPTKLFKKVTNKTDAIAQGKSDLEFENKEENIASITRKCDAWDWDDNWDETLEDKKDKAEVTSGPKHEIESAKVDSSDLSKWSGWETFGQKPQEKCGNWGLGSWGVDMFLNKATAVTQGISNVLEAGLGAPDPETLARMEKLEREKLRELEPEESQGSPEEISKKNSLTNVNLFPVSGITSLVAGVTSKIVEHSKIQEIGSKVITGGLETLETVGKKTMEVLQEGDPGLKNKRALLLGSKKPVLSQVLREAREKADREIKKAEEKEMAKKCHFETLFDDFQGMVHLEALEMLSKQCELKLEQIRNGMNSEEQEDLNGILEEVEQLCILDECELDLKSSVLDFKTVLRMAVEPLKNEISVHKIIQVHENVNNWLETSFKKQCSLLIINQKLVSTLAELTAATVQQFHKSGELLSVKECRKTVEEVDALSRLTNVLCTEINSLCEKFIVLCRSNNSTVGNADSINSMTEKVTVVMQNSTSYIRQAFDLLIPVIQLGAAI